MSFSELGLSEKVLQAVSAAGYTSPTPIQAQAIPHALARRDVLGIAQTGTGKTAAFTLPMLNLLETGRARARMPRTLILEPTRELAAQVEESFVKLGANHKLSVALLIGGVSFADQDAKITRGVDVLIATPGRLLDHFERGKLLLTGIEVLVIDEADRMLDMGFIPDIERICKMVPFTRQTLFFSATMPPEIQRLTEQFLSNPVKIEVARPSSTASTITQRLVASGAEAHDKRAVLRNLIRNAEDLQNAIIFCNRKRDVAILLRSLERHRFNAVALHGDMDQMSRMQALDKFRTGGATLLVASDVAARGLDIPEVSHVFNYDVPFHAEDYVHRIGRTGRAGRSGYAASIVTSHDAKALAAIEALTGQPIAWEGPTIDELLAEQPELEQPDTRRGRSSSRREGGETRERRGTHAGRSVRRTDAPEPAEVARRNAPPPRQHEPVRAGDRHSRFRREDDDLPVVGFGNHIPAFLLRAVNLDALSSDNDFTEHDNELEVIEDVADEAGEDAAVARERAEQPATGREGSSRRNRSRRAKSIAIRTPEDEAPPEAASAAEAAVAQAAPPLPAETDDATAVAGPVAVVAEAPLPEAQPEEPALAESQPAEIPSPETSSAEISPAETSLAETPAAEPQEPAPAKPARRTRRKAETAGETPAAAEEPAAKPTRTRRKTAVKAAEDTAATEAAQPGATEPVAEEAAAKPVRRRRKAAAEANADVNVEANAEAGDETPKRTRRTKKAAEEVVDGDAATAAAKKPAARRSRKKAEAAPRPDAEQGDDTPGGERGLEERDAANAAPVETPSET
jgi:superfamily II DNA/RNA helicase